MQEILKAHGKISDKLHNDIEHVFHNQFIDYADETVILGYENKLGIAHETSVSLEERKRIVKAYLIGGGRVSISTIKEMIEAYTNSEVTCQLRTLNANKDYGLYIEIDNINGNSFNMKEICAFLNTKLPAHIKYTIHMGYNKEIEIVYDYELDSPTVPKCGELNCGEEVSLCF